MAENGVNGHRTSGTEWKVGFMNSALKYLTAETFGYKVNASGPALKKKQIWVIEQESSENTVYIRSHLGRYMTSDRYGVITVEAEERTDDAKFTVEYSKNGKWAFKHVLHGNYLSGYEAEVKCFDKSPSDYNWWSIQLYVHPQINIRNANRKRYAHLNKETNELECSEVIPWGADSQVFLDFVEGRYTLKACDNRYLNRDGTLQANIDDNTLFTMEVHSGCLAFKDTEGRYLTAVGKGTLKGRNKTISKDELFTIEDSHPQVQIVSHNGKSVSVKQGVDVSANQPTSSEEIEDTEIFQLEFNKVSETWALRASTGKYWSLQSSCTVQALSSELQPNCYFEIDWQEDGSVGIKGCDGKYLSNKQTGILFSTSSTLEDNNRFRINIVNRPLLVLKSEFGFVGIKGSQFICNKSKYDVISVIPKGNGFYNLKGPDGKYLGLGSDNMVVSESSPTDFHFRFCGRSHVAIKAPNRCYLKGEQNGLFKAEAEEIIPTALWEF